MNDSFPGLRVAQHSTIPASPVALGRAPWGGNDGPQTPHLQVAIPVLAPTRFSERAHLAGDQAGAAHLRKLERIGEAMAIKSAPGRFMPEIWEQVLTTAHYPEMALGRVLAAIRNGLSIDPQPDAVLGLPLFMRNHASVYAHIPFVQTKLQKQLTGRTLMVWPQGPPPHCVLPLGVVTKFKSYEDKVAYDRWERGNLKHLQYLADVDFGNCQKGQQANVLAFDGVPPTPPRPKGQFTERIIHDARFGINDRGEPPPMEKLNTLRQIAHAARPGDYSWVEDISGAFKLVKILGWQVILTGTAAFGTVMVDTCLTFGLNTSPQGFQSVVGHPLLWVVQYHARQANIGGSIHQYVDDHIGLAHGLEASVRQNNLFHTVCHWFNIPLEPPKRRPPAQSNPALGLILHTGGPVRVECPPEKLEWIREILTDAAGRDKITVKQLDTVCGMIGFIAVSIHGALVFSAELRDALRRAKESHTTIVGLTAALREDIAFWQLFAAQWNGMEVILSAPAVPFGHISADAMVSLNESAIGLFVCGRGFRIPVSASRWAGGPRPDAARDIAILELVAYALQIAVVAALFPGTTTVATIPGATDNATVRARIARGWCRDPLANSILRFAWRASVFSRVNCSVTWIPSERNVLSDAPSRNDQRIFSSALSAYYSQFSRSGAAPAWWPRDIRFEPGAHRPFTICDPESPLTALAEHLGTANSVKVPSDARQVALFLSQIRGLFN